MTTYVECYGDEIFAHGNGSERSRLDALAEELDPATFTLLSAAPGRPDPRCLELAAGTGTVALWLAHRFPSGSVVGTDIDLRFLNSDGVENVDFIHHNVTCDHFPSASFDLIHARYLLCHLRERDRTLPRIVEWLEPGGQLILEEPLIFPFQSSPYEPYRKVSLGVLDVAADRIGTDGLWARELPSLMRDLGMTEIKVDPRCSTVAADTAMGRFWKISIRELSPALIQLPGVDQADVETVIHQLSNPGFVDLGLLTLAVTATKPLTSQSAEQ